MNFNILSKLNSLFKKKQKKEDTPPPKIFYIDESNDDIQILLDELNEKVNKSPFSCILSFLKKLLKSKSADDPIPKSRKLPTPK